ncbi:MAG: hypothetical protein AAF639_03735 [Chloroflexota bacterium]
MIYSYDYDVSYHPAMPMVDLQISLTEDDPPIVVTAMVDSGSDATTIPIRYVRQLKAPVVDTQWMSGITGERHLVKTYAVFVRIGNTARGLSVVGDKINHVPLLGRDMLNQLVVTLDGYAQVVEVKD